MNILDKITELQKIVPKPGDTIIIKINNITLEESNMISNMFKEKYGENISILVLPLESEVKLIKGKYIIGDKNE